MPSEILAPSKVLVAFFPEQFAARLLGKYPNKVSNQLSVASDVVLAFPESSS